MRPDAALFEAMELAGHLHITVARERGSMVGYMLFIVRPHPHYADVLCGFEDAYYLIPEQRKGMRGVSMIRAALNALKSRGVKRVFIHTKKAKNMGRVLEFLGMSHSDEIYSAWIGA